MVEHYLDTVGVTGSNPVSRTIVTLPCVSIGVPAYCDCTSADYGIAKLSGRNKTMVQASNVSNKPLNIQSNPMITRSRIALSVAFLLTPALSLLVAVEHPHSLPQTTQMSQLPQNQSQSASPSHQVAKKEVSPADISVGIRKDISNKSKKSRDKKFHTEHKGKDLALDLVKVHGDGVSSLGNGKYFACVDMKATDGTTYDIDFFMTGKPGAMKVTETSVHKVNGKPLYNWKEEGGVWKKVSKS